MSDDEEVKATIFGHTIQAKGLNGIIAAILAIALFAVGYLLWESSHQIAKDSGNEHEAIGNSIEGVGSLLEEQNYIILLDEAERKELKRKLRQPPSLRNKLER